MTLFSQDNSTAKKPASILSEISFHQGRLLPAPLSLDVMVVMMGQLEAVNVPGLPHSLSWQWGGTGDLSV